MEKTILLKFKDMGDFTVKMPNVGQFMEIENLKIALTNGLYGEMVKQNTKLSNMNLDIVDAISNFRVLVPELRELAKIKNFSDIDLFTAKSLAVVYKKQFAPWLNEIINELQTYGEDDDEE